jgi:hypothetical protein
MDNTSESKRKAIDTDSTYESSPEPDPKKKKHDLIKAIRSYNTKTIKTTETQRDRFEELFKLQQAEINLFEQREAQLVYDNSKSELEITRLNELTSTYKTNLNERQIKNDELCRMNSQLTDQVLALQNTSKSLAEQILKLTGELRDLENDRKSFAIMHQTYEDLKKIKAEPSS